jgi:hypothetical protein
MPAFRSASRLLKSRIHRSARSACSSTVVHGQFADLVELSPAKAGRLYDWAYRNDLIIGSGVNIAGVKRT